MVAAKLAIYEAMRRQGLTQAALAERLGCDPRQVRRLLDLDHASTLAQLERARRRARNAWCSRSGTRRSKRMLT